MGTSFKCATRERERERDVALGMEGRHENHHGHDQMRSTRKVFLPAMSETTQLLLACTSLVNKYYSLERALVHIQPVSHMGINRDAEEGF